MVIKLSESALNKLKALELSEEKFARIDADVAGGCGISVKFSLIFDEPRRNDIVIEHDGVILQIDRFTKRYLDEETHIDYTEEHGFVMGESSFASSACAIEIN